MKNVSFEITASCKLIEYLRETRIFWSKQRVGSQKVAQFLHAFRVFSWHFKFVFLSLFLLED